MLTGVAYGADAAHGAVVFAHDLASGSSRQVVIKFYSLPDKKEKFERENLVLKMLNRSSPGTAPMRYDEFECERTPGQKEMALVIEAGTQVALGIKSGSAEEHQRRSEGMQLLQCVDALHCQQKVHCDLKPEHFLRFAGARCWRLIDYDSVVPDEWEGIPTYTQNCVSPEVARCIENGTMPCITYAVDVWSLGLVMFELFLGEPLNDSWTVESVARLTQTDVNDAISEFIRSRNLQARIDIKHCCDIIEKMLCVDPASRITIKNLLRKSFFQVNRVSSEASTIIMLGLFCSPRKFVGADGRRMKVPTSMWLNLDAEMQGASESIPNGQHCLRPAARFPKDIVAPLREPKNKVAPRVIHFAGHGDAGHSNPALGEPGALCFQNEDGTMHLPSPQDFVSLLQSLYDSGEFRDGYPECIVLNGCFTCLPLAQDLHAAFPKLYILSWETELHDTAGTKFASGFYGYLGKEYREGRPGTIAEAVQRGKDSFLEHFLLADRAAGTATPAGTKPAGGVLHVHWPTVGSSS